MLDKKIYVIKSRSYVVINASITKYYQHNAKSKFYLNILTLIRGTSIIKEKEKKKRGEKIEVVGW